MIFFLLKRLVENLYKKPHTTLPLVLNILVREPKYSKVWTMLANQKFADVSIEFAFAGETSDQYCLNKLTLPTTPAPTDGSQCSSSCSTVVITGYSHEETKAQVRDN